MSYKYTAIIIEPRKHKAIEFVLNNVCDCLSDEWKIVFFHGTDNVEYVSNITEKLNILFKNRISLVNLNIDNLDSIEYSRLFATKSIIYDFIDTDIFLVFQTDSMIFKQNAHLINDFLEYDYVGAPWLITNYYPTLRANFIGNGGFSLRNKNKMFEIIEKIDWDKLTELTDKLDDLYFSKTYDGITVKKPDYNKACQFCVDEVFYHYTFACHKPWFPKHFLEFKKIYPESEILYSLQEVEY
jgi:hypothetical protein